MVNYSNGKIYTIRSVSQPDLIYIGSTTQSLASRFYGHKSTYKGLLSGKKTRAASSAKVFECGDAYIELLKYAPCESKEELAMIEGEVIRSIDCVNIQLKLTDDEKKEKYRDNMRKYRAGNSKAIRENVRETQRKYVAANREKINKRACEQRKKDQAVKVQCECGRMISQCYIKTHRESTRHIREFIMS